MRQNSWLFKVDATERYTINNTSTISYGVILKMECDGIDSWEFTGRKSSQMFLFYLITDWIPPRELLISTKLRRT